MMSSSSNGFGAAGLPVTGFAAVPPPPAGRPAPGTGFVVGRLGATDAPHAVQIPRAFSGSPHRPQSATGMSALSRSNCLATGVGRAVGFPVGVLDPGLDCGVEPPPRVGIEVPDVGFRGVSTGFTDGVTLTSGLLRWIIVCSAALETCSFPSSIRKSSSSSSISLARKFSVRTISMLATLPLLTSLAET